MFVELLQPTHILIIVAILLLLFGGRWFATLGRGFRDAIRNFKQATNSTRPK
jgi:TatA/E family protein of Tat protein translocase